MSNTTILYDLPCRGDRKCWSPNCWKSRLVLNYKQIPYETEWLDQPDIPGKLKSLGIAPNPPGALFEYSLPTIRASDGACVMDSLAIAQHLEKLQPAPSLHMDDKLYEKAQEAIHQTAMPLLAVILPRISREVICEHAVDFVNKARAEKFGMPLEEMEAKRGGEPAWKAAEPGMANLKAILTEHKKDEGPFILGSQVSYGDFIIAAMTQAFLRVGEDVFERLVSYDDSFRQVWEACQPWFEKKT